MKLKNILDIKFTFTSYHCTKCDTNVLKPLGGTDCKFEKGESFMKIEEIILYVEDDCLPF